MKRFPALTIVALASASPVAARAEQGRPDEFDGKAIDRSKWGFEVDCRGGGNNGRQCYTQRARNALFDRPFHWVQVWQRDETVIGAGTNTPGEGRE